MSQDNNYKYSKKSNRLEFLRNQYDNSKNIKQFLTTIKKQDCFIYKGWLDAFINRYVPNMYGVIMKFPMRKHRINIEIIRKEKQPGGFHLFPLCGIAS